MTTPFPVLQLPLLPLQPRLTSNHLFRVGTIALPLLVIGAVGFYTTGNQDFVEQLRGAFSALPMNIATFAREPAETWRGHAAAAPVVLLVLVFLINLVAIVVRARITKRLGR